MKQQNFTTKALKPCYVSGEEGVKLLLSAGKTIARVEERTFSIYIFTENVWESYCTLFPDGKILYDHNWANALSYNEPPVGAELPLAEARRRLAKSYLCETSR